MAFSKKNITPDPTTGFGTNSQQSGSRFYKKDGSANVVRKGVPFFDRFSWYHSLLSMPRWEFWLTLFGVYLLVNFLFAIIYYSIGIEHLGGIETGSPVKNFVEAFFFSAQTITTVGYGRVSPIGFFTSAVAAFEAFIGVLSFALASGLFYGRFSMPKSYLYFSKNALIAPFKEGQALMFRTVPFKNNHLIDAEVKLTLAMRVKENGNERNLFFPLNVEFSKINSLVLNWTIVHPIDENSPIYNTTLEDLREAKAEVMVFIKAYDEIFANTVIARTSYTADELITNAKFKPMYHSSEQGNATILDVSLLNDYEILENKPAVKQPLFG